MISAFHFIWIIPLSAVAGTIVALWIVLVDDCLWWASNKSEKGNNGIAYENEPPILPPEDWPEWYVKEIEEELRRERQERKSKRRERRRKP